MLTVLIIKHTCKIFKYPCWKNYQSFFQSWREAQNLVKSENMYALGLPISVHPSAPEGPNMSMPSVGAMGTEQCSVLDQKTVGIWNPVCSQESEDM